MRVHRRPGVLGERLRHERSAHAVAERDLLDHVPERHHVVGHRQRVGVAQVDLLLARRAFVVAELDRDTHLLQRVDGVAAEVRRRVVHGLVEIPAVVGGHWHRAVILARLQQEELDLGVHVAGEAEVAGLGQLAAQHVSRVGPRRRAVGHRDVAEHPRRVVLARTAGPRQHLERRRVGPGHHVGFRDPGKALDRGAVEADALLEGAFEFGGRDRYGLEVSEYVGEPQPDEADVAFLQRAQHEFLLPIHDRSVGSGC